MLYTTQFVKYIFIVHVKFAKRNISNVWPWPWLTMPMPNPDSRGCRRERTLSWSSDTPFNSYALSVAARVYHGVSIIWKTVSRIRETLRILERFFRLVSDGLFSVHSNTRSRSIVSQKPTSHQYHQYRNKTNTIDTNTDLTPIFHQYRRFGIGACWEEQNRERRWKENRTGYWQNGTFV